MKIRGYKKWILAAGAVLTLMLWMPLSGIRAEAAGKAGGDPEDPLFYTGGLMAGGAEAEEDGETASGEAGAYYGPVDGKGLSHDSRFSETDHTIGIDVSYYQGNINWTKVRAAGVRFAIIRCGYSTLSKGEKNQDVKFLEYMKGAHAAGIKVGVYYFSQAISTAEAKAEAEFAARIIRSSGITPDLPVFMDVEIVSSSIYSRMISANMSRDKQTSVCRAFCKTIEDKGYRAGVYSSMNYYYTRMNADQVAADYIIWLAHYTNKTTYTGDYSFWQHGSTGTVNGIGGAVDCDIWYDIGTFAGNSSCTKPEKNGWQTAEGKVYYVDPETGEKVRGLQEIEGRYYYFSRISGKRMTGFRTVDGNTYYFDKRTGVRREGKVKISGSTYYFDPATGIMQTGFLTLGSDYYYFGSDGVMRTGWQKVDKVRYRFRTDGRMYKYKGWKTLSGNTYYFGSGHGTLTGWQTISGRTYYFGGNGVMRTGWQTLSSARYYFGKDGVMRTGLRKIGTYRYYFDDTGVMQTGWQTIKGIRYYFNRSNGHALTGKRILGGRTYVFDKEGRLT